MNPSRTIFFAFSPLLVAAAATLWFSAPAPDCAPAAEQAAAPPIEASGAAAEPALAGLWMRADIKPESDAVRFHYFHHEGNIGLYRYGKRCLNNTHSYDYGVSGDGRMQLLYKKTGRRAHIEYRISKDNKGNEFLTLSPDPEEGRVVRYRKVRPPVEPDLLNASAPAPGFDRMWMHAEKFVTGGMGFNIYQMQPPGLDGRGTGWFHTGDFNDWSTESLVYHRTPPERTGDKDGRLALDFACRDEQAKTRFAERQNGEQRSLLLKRDPRNFWHKRAYTDAGKSFMTAAYGGDTPELGGPLYVPLGVPAVVESD